MESSSRTELDDPLVHIDCPVHGETTGIIGDIDGQHWCCGCLEEWEEDPRSNLCFQCHEPIGDDYYMVHDEVWAAAGNPEYKCQVHLRCLALQLGRELALDDFTDAPVNAFLREQPLPLG